MRDSHEIDASDLGAPAGAPSPRFLADHLRERGAQSWLNLRVWIPGLANPDLRDRDVVYGARECRDVTQWRVVLPERCWQCDTADGLTHVECRGTVRSFEYPLHVLVAGLSTTFLLTLFAWWIGGWFTWLLALGAAAATAGLVWLKSWVEMVRVVFWTCGDHASPMPRLEMVVDDAELHLFLPNRRIAEQARELQRENRRRHQPHDALLTGGIRTPSSGTSPDAAGGAATSGRYVSPFEASRPQRAELPPIQLDEGPLSTDTAMAAGETAAGAGAHLPDAQDTDRKTLGDAAGAEG